MARSNGDDPDGSTGQQAVSDTYSATSESFNGKPVWKGQHMKLCWAPDQGVQGDGTYGRCAGVWWQMADACQGGVGCDIGVLAAGWALLMRPLVTRSQHPTRIK